MTEKDLGARISIQIEGRDFLVPAGDFLLAAVQYILREEVPALSRFCWSDECGNCEMTLTTEGEVPRRVRGCQTKALPDMRLSELTPDLRYWLHGKLR